MLTDLENKLLVARGKGIVGRDREFGWTCIHVAI